MVTNNVEFPFEPRERYGDVRTIASKAGIELRGDDGQPYCCDERMQVKAGIFGPDFARCHQCDLQIWNSASPHINGGIVLNESVLERFGDEMWSWNRYGG